VVKKKIDYPNTQAMKRMARSHETADQKLLSNNLRQGCYERNMS